MIIDRQFQLEALLGEWQEGLIDHDTTYEQTSRVILETLFPGPSPLVCLTEKVSINRWGLLEALRIMGISL